MDSMTRVTARPRKTVKDYLALPEDVRAELIEGEIYVTPSPTTNHQRVSLRLAVVLEGWLRGKAIATLFAAPCDVHLPSGDVVQPDLIVVAERNADIVRDWIVGVPDLLVEIVSRTHSERDRIVKRDLYARNGVAEYWIVDPEAETIEVLRLQRDAYVPAGYFERGSTLTSESLPGFRLPIDDVFAS